MFKKALPYFIALIVGGLLMWIWDWNTMYNDSDLDARIKPYKDTIILQQHKIRLYEMQDDHQDSIYGNIIARQDSVINGIRHSSSAEYIGHANNASARS